MVQSKALEVNIASYYVDVTIDEKYSILQEVMSRYYGIMEGFNTFLKELSHPYKNWQFIVQEARVYSLDYFHLLKTNPKGPESARLFVDIFIQAINTKIDLGTRADAVDNLLLFIQKIIKESGTDYERFKPIIDYSFDRIKEYEGEDFFLFVKSFYQIRKLAQALLTYSTEKNEDCGSINRLLVKYYDYIYGYWLAEKDPWEWFKEEADKIDSPKKLKPFFKEISHDQINQHKVELENVSSTEALTSEDTLKSLV
ncbi:MAG TPA: pyruvate, phosphate dikinase, partial [Desulfobacterales bacterium]|nr:pyruvate, phosphate dikinase [Desulfobacterales bacterium]